MMAIELVIEETIIRGLRELRADPRILRFCFQELKDDVLDTIEELIAKPIFVHQAFDRLEAENPAFVIQLADEPISERFLGNFQRTVQDERIFGDPDNPVPVDIEGPMMEANYIIGVYGKDRRETLYLYNALKAILEIQLPKLYSLGVKDLSYNGTDLNPYADSIPQLFYFRNLAVNLKYTVEVPRLGRETDIEGFNVTVTPANTGDLEPDNEPLR